MSEITKVSRTLVHLSDAATARRQKTLQSNTFMSLLLPESCQGNDSNWLHHNKFTDSFGHDPSTSQRQHFARQHSFESFPAGRILTSGTFTGCGGSETMD